MSNSETKLQKYSAPALEKGLDIIEFLSVTNTPPTLSQLASGIGRSKSEIFRMIIVLEERGYIERRDGELFSITDKLALVGSTRSDTSKLAEIAGPYLERLSEETSLSNHLSVRQDDHLVTIATAEAAQQYGLSAHVGYQHKLFGTAAGACILAHPKEQTDRQDLIDRVSEGQSASAIKQFAELVESCWKNSSAQAPNPDLNSILEIASPVRQAIGNIPIGTISIPMIHSNDNSNALAMTKEKLKSACRLLEKKIAISLPAELQF